jgi:uncharacterized repeat protein (TIGR04052 family)
MLFHKPVSRRAQVIITTLSVSWLGACSDDAESSGPPFELIDAGHEHEAHSSEKPSGSKTSSAAKSDAGSSSDDAAASKPNNSDDDTDAASEARDEAPAPDKPGTKDAGAASEKPTLPVSLKVSVRFQAKVGKTDFACSHKYASQGTQNTTVTPLDLRLFVHALELIAEDGALVPVQLNPRAPWQSETLALLDFEDNTGRCVDGTAETNTAITGTVPPGSYKGIRFMVGVPEDLNHKDPSAASEPLKSAAGLSTTGVDGYRFAKLGLTQLSAEGVPSGSGVFELSSTQCAGSVLAGDVKCERTNRNLVTFDNFDLATNSVVLDVARLFSPLDLTQPQACHSTEAICASMFAAFGIDYTTGQAQDEQSAFRVE